MLRKTLVSLSALSLVAAPVAAQAAPAPERTSATVTNGERLVGNPWVRPLIGALVIAAIVWVIVDDDNEPDSP